MRKIENLYLNSRSSKKRRDNEPPQVIAHNGWRYHHLGIPTEKPRPGEHYIKHLKIYVSGFETSPYGIEWIRFDNDCPISDIVKTVPHIAFEVDNLATALQGKQVISQPGSPSKGVKVAMIVDNGAPIELIEFEK